MKLWQLLSAFSSEQQVLREVLALPRWREPYLRLFESFGQLVASQDRATLDIDVPLELTRQVFGNSVAKFVLWPTPENLREFREGGTGYKEQVSLPKLSALEVHERFGPAVLEEVREYGSAFIGGRA